MIDGFAVHPLCLGGNVFGWTLDEAASFAVLDAYFDGGGNFIDTADAYANWEPVNRGGVSEEIIGRWLRRRGIRDEIVLATKVGGEVAPGRQGLAGAYVRAAVDDSLRRLGVDRIDLLYAHYDDPATPLEETLGAFDELVRAGKVRALGASNFGVDRLAEALSVSASQGFASYAAVQPEFNLIDRAGYEAELEALCVARGLAVMPYYALANGLLTGKYRREDPWPDTPRAQDIRELYLQDGRAWPIIDAVVDVAGRVGATPAQVALAWLMQRPSITAPIASATSPAQVRELLGATDVALSDADIRRLESA
jgi:aryl-alcohol dehydrogenase-like predicted oxidoreductase